MLQPHIRILYILWRLLGIDGKRIEFVLLWIIRACMWEIIQLRWDWNLKRMNRYGVPEAESCHFDNSSNNCCPLASYDLIIKLDSFSILHEDVGLISLQEDARITVENATLPILDFPLLTMCTAYADLTALVCTWLYIYIFILDYRIQYCLVF